MGIRHETRKGTLKWGSGLRKKNDIKPERRLGSGTRGEGDSEDGERRESRKTNFA